MDALRARLGFCVEASEPVGAQPREFVHLATGGGMMRSHDYEMRRIRQAYDRRRLRRQGPRQASGSAPKRGRLVRATGDGVEIRLARRVEQQNPAAHLGVRREANHNAMARELRGDIRNQSSAALSIHMHLPAALRHAPLGGKRRRQDDALKSPRSSDLGKLRRPMPAHEAIDLLEGEIGPGEISNRFVSGRDGLRPGAVAARKVECEGPFRGDSRKTSQDRKGADSSP